MIETNKFRAFTLNKEFPEHFAKAKSMAEKDKEQKELLADKSETPGHVQRYLEEEYPQHSYSIIHLDIVRMTDISGATAILLPKKFANIENYRLANFYHIIKQFLT